MKTLVIIGSFLAVGLIVFFWAIGVSNAEIKVRMRGDAEKKVVEAYYDKMWKIISQEAQVAEKYKDSFKEIYVPLIEGRYSKGDGSLMKWITEQNPNFDTKLFDNLMVAIEGQREGFFIEQNKLIDIDREHKTMRKVWPKSMIIGKRADLDYKVISSTLTKQVVESGIDDNVDLFK